MARNKKPYFKFFADDYLTDPGIKVMTYEERGICQTLWAWMWVNKIKRGHLFLDRWTPLSDEQIAEQLLHINIKQWMRVKNSLLKIKKIKVGKKNQVYSPWLSKYKTRYELYEKKSETKRKQI